MKHDDDDDPWPVLYLAAIALLVTILAVVLRFAR